MSKRIKLSFWLILALTFGITTLLGGTAQAAQPDEAILVCRLAGPELDGPVVEKRELDRRSRLARLHEHLRQLTEEIAQMEGKERAERDLWGHQK